MGKILKTIFTCITFILLFSACNTKNAFSNLTISKEQSLAIESTKSGTLSFERNTKGVFSAIYLNNIYKNKFPNTHTFYVAVYLKGKEGAVTFSLNKQTAIEVKEMIEYNTYTNLLPKKNLWTKYFLVSFQDDSQKELNLVIDNGQFSSGQLNYLKDEQ